MSRPKKKTTEALLPPPPEPRSDQKGFSAMELAAVALALDPYNSSSPEWTVPTVLEIMASEVTHIAGALDSKKWDPSVYAQDTVRALEGIACRLEMLARIATQQTSERLRKERAL